ncbi:Gfo/Idh/MocA family oxidoreductase [Aquimarina sp. 2201CG5-10]|uniref:Gfo/Idh/MocA family protein n=1 Tax=Aquimarina callyspongiae TaxID=3098150 RepID=UPI002AB4CECC|nr:Gfo/Idh/MocA family oxidoreductase [Aquimarina sp. 2201CG5-10]MDY8136317.1 Gfo/Idh/MocA family oxidoreductase [Aquimarina sp. 2201CG5-10]
MNQDKNVKWGILGCGKIAHKFAKDLMSIPNAIIYATASRNLQKAKNFGKAYNSVVFYGSYQELAQDKNIDIIYIATPHVFHFENTMMCLHHSKAVLCEKPFAMNIKQVEEMIVLAKNKNVFLMEALWTYFLPHYQYVLNVIASKELGEVKSLKADFGFASDFDATSRVFNKKLGGGSLLDVGIYPLFAALSILGYPEEIEAKAHIGKTGVDENCTMALQYKNGVQASLFSAIDEETTTTANIQFDKGSIYIHSRFHEPSSITIQKDGISETIHFEVLTNGYSFEAIHAQEMLLNDKTESTIMTFEKSLQLIQLLDTVRNKIGLHYT